MCLFSCFYTKLPFCTSLHQKTACPLHVLHETVMPAFGIQILTKKESPRLILSMISWIKVMTKTVRRLFIIISRFIVRTAFPVRKYAKIALVEQ